jgi:hypothetical protein
MMRTCCVAVVCFVVLGSIAGAQVDGPASRLESASALTSLDDVDQKPWHLKLDVTVFGEKGKNPSEGTIEVWHAGPDQRTVYTSSTTLKHDGKTYYSKAGPSLPFEANEALQEVLHPGPRAIEIEGTVPELRKQKFGASEFDCVMLTQPIKGSTPVPLGLFPTYCLSNGIIRIAYNFGGQAVVLNRMGTFLGRDVALETGIREGKFDVASAKIVALAIYTPQPDEFLPAASMVQEGTEARISGSVIAGNRVSFVAPLYPDSAKIAHESGKVVLRAIIGRDGHIHSLRPTSATDPDFVIAAITAVRQWVYKPYLLNGEPT